MKKTEHKNQVALTQNMTIKNITTKKDYSSIQYYKKIKKIDFLS